METQLRFLTLSRYLRVYWHPLTELADGSRIHIPFFFFLVELNKICLTLGWKAGIRLLKISRKTQ